MKQLLPLFLIFLLIFSNFHAEASVANCSTQSDSLFFPKAYTDGWLENEKGKREFYKIKFDVDGQRIFFLKEGKPFTYSIGIEKFGFLDENKQEVKFARIQNKSLNKYSGYFLQDIFEIEVFL